jgi:7-cyano-7-deazaguanine synthase
MNCRGSAEAIVLVSGGMDSCVSCAWARSRGWGLRLLHVSYGQRTERREHQAFDAIADHYGVPAERRLTASIAYLTAIGGSSLTDRSIPVEEADLRRESPPSSYVPFRNAHLLSIAVSWAEVQDVSNIVIGAVHEDSSGYPDCRPEYYEAFNRLVQIGTARGDIHIHTPLIGMTKAQIVQLGTELHAPFHLTWSCYQGEELACGVCDSCALRLRGFALAGIEDPLPYRSRADYR